MKRYIALDGFVKPIGIIEAATFEEAYTLACSFDRLTHAVRLLTEADDVAQWGSFWEIKSNNRSRLRAMHHSRQFALMEVTNECKQLEIERGYLLDLDLKYDKGELLQAAGYYCLTEDQRSMADLFSRSDSWPIQEEPFQATSYRVQQLVKAAQYLIFEIARLHAIRHDHIDNVLPADDGSNMEAFKLAFTQAALADNLPQSDMDNVSERQWQEAYAMGVSAIDAYKDMYYE